MAAQKPKFSVVGKSIPRVDAAAKVRGTSRFSDDLGLPGMVYGKIKASAVAHGLIKKIDTSRALNLPGVLAVITGEESPKPFSINNHLPTETPLALDKVRYYGEGVAAVAAIDEAIAEDAVDLIEVEYEELPALLDPVEAMERDDLRIHDFAYRNIHVEGLQEFGDVDDALKGAHLVVENSYRSSYVNVGFLEPQSTLADYDLQSKKLTVYTCTQLPHYLQGTLSRALDIPMEKLRVVVPTVGGGFGGKTEATPACLLACILSRKLGRPVKITYDRKDVYSSHQ